MGSEFPEKGACDEESESYLSILLTLIVPQFPSLIGETLETGAEIPISCLMYVWVREKVGGRQELGGK